MPSGLPLAVMITISLAENTTYHDAAALLEPATGLFIRTSSITAGEDGANTSQASPLTILSASSLETPGVSVMTRPGCLASNALLSERIGPARESAWSITSSEAVAPSATAALSPASTTGIEIRVVIRLLRQFGRRMSPPGPDERHQDALR